MIIEAIDNGQLTTDRRRDHRSRSHGYQADGHIREQNLWLRGLDSCCNDPCPFRPQTVSSVRVNEGIWLFLAFTDSTSNYRARGLGPGVEQYTKQPF